MDDRAAERISQESGLKKVVSGILAIIYIPLAVLTVNVILKTVLSPLEGESPETVTGIRVCAFLIISVLAGLVVWKRMIVPTFGIQSATLNPKPIPVFGGGGGLTFFEGLGVLGWLAFVVFLALLVIVSVGTAIVRERAAEAGVPGFKSMFNNRQVVFEERLAAAKAATEKAAKPIRKVVYRGILGFDEIHVFQTNIVLLGTNRLNGFVLDKENRDQIIDWGPKELKPFVKVYENGRSHPGDSTWQRPDKRCEYAFAVNPKRTNMVTGFYVAIGTRKKPR